MNRISGKSYIRTSTTKTIPGTTTLSGILCKLCLVVELDLFQLVFEISPVYVTLCLIQVCQEIDAVIGHEGTPHYDDRTRMPYTEATIAELLRIRPIAPLGIPHINTESIVFRGYLLPERSIIMMNMVGMHLDPELWPDPETFDPTRFLSEDGKATKKPEGHMPFGAGISQ